jgi:hypothetical protein
MFTSTYTYKSTTGNKNPENCMNPFSQHHFAFLDDPSSQIRSGQWSDLEENQMYHTSFREILGPSSVQT